MCLDCDKNIDNMSRDGKRSLLVKYLEYSSKSREQQQQQNNCKIVSARADITGEEVSGASVQPQPLSEEALHVHRLSHLIPVELWSIALVTLSDKHTI